MQTFIKAKRSSSWSTVLEYIMTQRFNFCLILLTRIFVFHIKYSLLLPNKSPRSIMDFTLTPSNTRKFALASEASERPKQTKQLRASTQRKQYRPTARSMGKELLAPDAFYWWCFWVYLDASTFPNCSSCRCRMITLKATWAVFPSLIHLDSDAVAETSCSFSMVHW